MCTYATETVPIEGSAKGRGPDAGWFRISRATVYFDHPVHAMVEHTLNIDFADPTLGPSARVAVELTGESAMRLVEAIQLIVGAVPARAPVEAPAAAPTTAPVTAPVTGRAPVEAPAGSVHQFINDSSRLTSRPAATITSL
ncbi:MAG: DUF6295 family protein, partial [Acidimicrobiales bacterium]